MSTFLQSRREGAILILTMSQPETRNALTGNSAADEFVQACDAIRLDTSIRAVVLTAEGPVFSSGGNVKDMMRYQTEKLLPETIREEYRNGIQRIPKALYNLDVPVIAAINGPAIGAGLDLTCMCDIRIASDKASFAESFVKVGIVPGDGGAWLLPRAVGASKAAEMAFTGELLNAEQALACGLVTRVVPWTRSSTSSGGKSMAARAAVMLATGLVGRVGTLAVRGGKPPGACTATMSVNVPPISMPTCQPGMKLSKTSGSCAHGLGVEMRDGREQFLGIGGLRGGKDAGTRPLFHDASLLQHDGALTHHPHHIEVVADKEVGEPLLAPQFVQQLEDHGLHGDIKGGGGFIENQQPRAGGDSPGNAHPRLLPPRQLMRKAVE